MVLLSGGLDSTTALAVARSQGLACYALTVRYGQLHQVELDAARRVASALGAREHRVVEVDLGPIAGSALTTPAIGLRITTRVTRSAPPVPTSPPKAWSFAFAASAR